jgi:hypothetical protein
MALTGNAIIRVMAWSETPIKRSHGMGLRCLSHFSGNRSTKMVIPLIV